MIMNKKNMSGKHFKISELSAAADLTEKLILDGTKIHWHQDRLDSWKKGERIAPITIDMALTRACNFACGFCYAMLQENDRQRITVDVMRDLIDDCSEIGVKGISLVSDGESTLSPAFIPSIQYGHQKGISMAVGTNAFVLDKNKLEQILPHLTYLRVNFSAGTRERYSEIMGVKPEWFDKVCSNIEEMVKIKKRDNLDVTIGMQMVLMPEDADQVVPLAKLGKKLRPDYLVIKHCSDDEDGSLGVNYDGYDNKVFDVLKEAETFSDEEYTVSVKWSKIGTGSKRSYQRCYGAPFIIQFSGSGLVAPCGPLFNDKYAKFHLGNICEERFIDIWSSDNYWEVMNYLASSNFNAQEMCGTLCLQHNVNEYLDGVKKGNIPLKQPKGSAPQHLNFI
jgi:MoaA/NifB/PqqE/SkfB family radical SAM enzyme